MPPNSEPADSEEESAGSRSFPERAAELTQDYNEQYQSCERL